MNDQIVFKTAQQLLASDWLDMDEAVGTLLKCIVMFKEKMPSGKPYMAIGWMHEDGRFEPDSNRHRSLTPERFIPLYDEA